MRAGPLSSYLFVAALLTGCGAAPSPTHSATPPHDALGTTLSGATVTLASLRGHPTVLAFWGSWCQPCRDEQPRLNAAYARWNHHGVSILGVDVFDSSGPADAFVAQYHVPYPSVADPNGDLATRYLVPAAPAIVLLDANGVAHDTVLGGLEVLSDADLDGKITALLRSG